ncbi:MAG: hypothetical protein ABSD51_05810, partial [Candidatus Binatus sp.]
LANRGGRGDPAYPRPLATQGHTVCHARLLRIMAVIRNPKIRGGLGARSACRNTVHYSRRIVPYRVRGETVEILRVFHAARKWPEKF